MNSFLLYIAQVAVSLIVLYLVYWLFFRKDTFYKLNRFFLITSIIIALLIPAFNFSFDAQQQENVFVVVLDTITISANQSNQMFYENLNIFQGILIAYLTGVFIFSLRFLFELYQILILIRKNRKTKRPGFTIVHLEKKYSPFSFFAYVFINKENSKADELHKILDHELVHVKQAHSLDLILLELLSIFQWFNPAVWLYRKSLKETHEFLADEELINQGYDISAYQKALLNHALGIQLNDITHNFNYSILKRRILMMTKQKTKTSGLLKYLAVLPVLAFLFAGFACSNMAEENPAEELSKAEETKEATMQSTENEVRPQSKPQEEKGEIYTVVEEMPGFKGGKEDLFKYLQENIQYPETAKKDSIQGTVFISFVVGKKGEVENVEILRGVRKDLDQESIRVVSEMPNWEPGKQNGKVVRVMYNLPIKYKLDAK
ncbi:MAG: M56 family metallopeptidase [Bacteroidota bacterium]|nr:M56 family metallopeptidase [Bacteroidota bacterium]